MKNIFVFSLVLVLLAGSITPAFAAGIKPVEPKLVISSPETAYAGESFTVSLNAKNVGKTPCLLNWQILFPKSVVADLKIQSGAKMLQNLSTADNWVFTWKKALKPGVSVSVEFQVTLRNDVSGLQNLLTVVSSKGIQLGSSDISILRPSLVWSIPAPSEMIYGGRPFAAVISVANPSSSDLEFDISVELFHVATDGSSSVKVSGGEIYWMEGNPTSITHFWRGIVPAGKEFYFSLETASGKYLGFYRLLEVNDFSGTQILIHDYQLVKGTGIPYDNLRVSSLNGGLIKPGDMLAFESYYFSPALGQFQITRVESNCPIQLPWGSTSRYGITYYYTLHYVNLLPMEKPEGVTGPYTVTCNITSTFNMLGDVNTKFYGTGSFEVTIP